MRITTIAMYAPGPSLELAADFYAALLDTHPRLVQNGDDVHFVAVSSVLTIEVYPATSCPHTTVRIEFTGDAEAAADRVDNRLHAAFERTPERDGWWTTDPIGNTVVLIDSDRPKQDEPPSTAHKLSRGDLVRLTQTGKVYRIIRLTRDGRAYLSADASHPESASRLPEANKAYDPNSLTLVSSAQRKGR